MASRAPAAARLERKKAEAAFIAHPGEMNDPIAEFNIGRWIHVLNDDGLSVALEAEKVSVKVPI
jgi:hypothetical protein